MAKVTKTVKVSPSRDASMDKKAGIKPGSKRDAALDKKRGVPPKY
jgi:hypothetical protein